MVDKALFSSSTGEWSTPQDFWDELDREFNFRVDLAASTDNAKCVAYFTKNNDALAFKSRWNVFGGMWWCNPPYGRELPAWLEKAAGSSSGPGVMLLPARTDTNWWHNYVWDRLNHGLHDWIDEIRFVKGRLKFGGAKNSAPFPSVIVVFK